MLQLMSYSWFNSFQAPSALKSKTQETPIISHLVFLYFVTLYVGGEHGPRAPRVIDEAPRGYGQGDTDYVEHRNRAFQGSQCELDSPGLGLAGEFAGNVAVFGNLSKGSGRLREEIPDTR